MPSPSLPRKPEARTEKVEDLVERVRRGQIRIPDFQRVLKWESDDVAALFDSVYRGYPIGSLLFYLREAPADRLELGPLVIAAPEVAEAWWVIDGQQRLAAFAACLLRPLPLPSRADRRDPFVLYFDAARQVFESPTASGVVPSTWVPMPHLLNASRLSEWIFGWEHRDDETLRTAVFDAGARIREYPIPLYLIEGDRQAARQIFFRTNASGKRLLWEEVHTALFGGDEPVPATLDQLADELEQIGMGRLAKERLLTCLMGLRGLDPTRSLAEHQRRDPACLEGAVQEALPVLRRVLSFLRADAGIPHLRLLPMSVLLDVLTRFFAVHPDPHPRTRTLLARWFWRTVLGAGVFDERTLRRQGIVTIDASEERSAQRLIGLLLHREGRRRLAVPRAFDARSDDNRIVLLTLVHLRPRSLVDGRPLDIPALLEDDGKDAFVKLVRGSGSAASRGAANRIVQPKGTVAMRLLRDQASQRETAGPVLASHAVDRRAADSLLAGDEDAFLAHRQEVLEQEVGRFTDRMAAWDSSDRPSVDFLLQEAGAGA